MTAKQISIRVHKASIEFHKKMKKCKAFSPVEIRNDLAIKIATKRGINPSYLNALLNPYKGLR